MVGGGGKIAAKQLGRRRDREKSYGKKKVKQGGEGVAGFPNAYVDGKG